jgi:hypothetical protein
MPTDDRLQKVLGIQISMTHKGVRGSTGELTSELGPDPFDQGGRYGDEGIATA